MSHHFGPASGLEPVLSRIVAATSADEVWDVVTDALREFGFDRLIYGFTWENTERGFGDPEDLTVLSSHDPDYTAWFVHNTEHAPMVQWAALNEGSMSWSHVASMELTEDQQNLVARNRELGVIAGYTISFSDNRTRHHGALGLTARPGLSQQDVDTLWRKTGAQIELIANIMHLKVLALPFGGRAQRLSSRQREVLEWVGDGKTVQDISVLLGITSATVEKHLRLARDTLGVETTAQAVLKASQQNQIFAPGGRVSSRDPNT